MIRAFTLQSHSAGNAQQLYFNRVVCPNNFQFPAVPGKTRTVNCHFVFALTANAISHQISISSRFPKNHLLRTACSISIKQPQLQPHRRQRQQGSRRGLRQVRPQGALSKRRRGSASCSVQRCSLSLVCFGGASERSGDALDDDFVAATGLLPSRKLKRGDGAVMQWRRGRRGMEKKK
jgi:hypothetical protein